MLQVLIVGDTPQLILDYLLDILLDLVVVVLYGLLHTVVAIRIQEIVDDGEFLITTFLPFPFSVSTTITAWNIFCSIRSLKLSETEPTNIPWVSQLILLGGMRLSIWVLMDVETSCRLMEIDWRLRSTLSVPFTLSSRLLFSNDQILSTKSVFLAFQFIDILKFAAKSLQTGNQQCGTEFLLQDIKNSCCHHILSLL